MTGGPPSIHSLLNYRCTPHSTTGVLPEELLYNRPLRNGIPTADTSNNPLTEQHLIAEILHQLGLNVSTLITVWAAGDTVPANQFFTSTLAHVVARWLEIVQPSAHFVHFVKLHRTVRM